MDKKVSIIVPTYNRRGWLPITLNSLVSQHYKNIEIIVINDDGEPVKDIIDGFADSRIKYFVNHRNLDLAGTRNVGLQKATGDYIMLCDDDDIITKFGIWSRMKLMEELEAEVVYTRALQVFLEKTELGQYKLLAKQLYWDSPFDKDLILVQNIAPCNCVLFSRKAWQDADSPTFDESLETSEDWDFWVHLSRANDFHELKIVDCECTHRTDNTQMTGTRQGYTTHLPYLFKKWRPYATNFHWVANAQNQSLKARGLNPEDYDL